jgi:glycosyltransferase involved in cell wall biosynthesis
MQFAILTTTHKRPSELLRAILSVQAQSLTSYTHYIVNDSPEYDYSEIEQTILADSNADSNIVYSKNVKNIGKNASLNSILQTLGSTDFNGYIVYLDDDDWLAPNCLADFTQTISENSSAGWLVSNRALENGISLTQNTTGRQRISYFFDYLLFKRFRGDATHCIAFAPAHAGSHPAQFPSTVANGEEWYYFLGVARSYGTFVYTNQIGTYTTGYDAGGLTSTIESSYKQNALRLLSERQTPSSFIYLLLRLCHSVFIK